MSGSDPVLRLRGRRSEREALSRLVASVRAGESRVVVLRGEAGVGKTALLEYLAKRASGCRIARAAGVESEVELAYALMAESWGRGLATELSQALLAVAFEHLGLEDLVCFTLTTNRASRRVMEKVGFTFERDVIHAGMPHGLHRIASPRRGETDTT